MTRATYGRRDGRSRDELPSGAVEQRLPPRRQSPSRRRNGLGFRVTAKAITPTLKLSIADGGPCVQFVRGVPHAPSGGEELPGA